LLRIQISACTCYVVFSMEILELHGVLLVKNQSIESLELCKWHGHVWNSQYS